MNGSKFQLLDSYFDARLGEPPRAVDAAAVADRARRVRRMSQRLNELAYPVFREFADYFEARLGEAAECYVDRDDGLDAMGRDTPPHVGFRWGAQGGRLNEVVFTGDVDAGEVHATWRCWRHGIPVRGDKTLDPFWSPPLVHSMLQELIFQFPPL
uniref:hypothetical protein n=1 Tax=unclassified Variovorax TaxID=663243 RepID=UPI000D36670D